MKITAVVVTYNRLEKLKKALSCYEKEANFLYSLVVVNNNSTDGTDKYLQEWDNSTSISNHHVINLPQNIGGAGGFATGQKYAMENGADWVFVADDDAYVSEGTFHSFINFVENSQERLSAVCAAVYNMDGTPSLEHRSNIKIGLWHYKIKNSLLDDYSKDRFYIDLFSYVGTFINIIAMREFGICNGNLFIYADDAEHSLRMKKYGKIVCLPSMKVFHDSGANNQKLITRMSWRDFYAIRNIILMIKKYSVLAALHCSLSAIHDVLYKKNIDCLKLVFSAIANAWLGVEGIHPKYKPGYNID